MSLRNEIPRMTAPTLPNAKGKDQKVINQQIVNSLLDLLRKDGDKEVRVRELERLGKRRGINWANLKFDPLPPIYANNAAAAANLDRGEIYRTGGNPDALCVRH